MPDTSNIYINTEATVNFNDSLYQLIAPLITPENTAVFMHRKNLYLADILIDIQSLDKRDGFSILPFDSPAVGGDQRGIDIKPLFEATDANFFSVAAAVKYNNHVFFMMPKARHCQINQELNRRNGKLMRSEIEMGFIAIDRDDRWYFKGRKEAFMEACFNGQLRRKSGNMTYQGDDLYSEDLF